MKRNEAESRQLPLFSDRLYKTQQLALTLYVPPCHVKENTT